jgi:hypothetical protein
MNKVKTIYAIIVTFLLIGSNWSAHKRICNLEADINKYRSYYENRRLEYNEQLEDANFYVNLIDSVVFVGMSEDSLVHIFTKDTICLIDKGYLNDTYSHNINCDYVYYFDNIESYFIIKNHKVIRTLNDWSYSCGIEVEHYFKTKQRLGVE